MDSKIDLTTLNKYFHIDVYISLSQRKRSKFRNELTGCIRDLENRFFVKRMSLDDVVTIALNGGPKATHAKRLLSKAAGNQHWGYDIDSIIPLALFRKQVLTGLFGDKILFYKIDDTTIGVDPVYIALIFGKRRRK